MNTTFTKEALAMWIAGLKVSAENDESLSIAWFPGTKNSTIAVIGGWQGGFDREDADLFCISKSNPTYAMSVKIAVNKGPYAYTDFEVMDMPVEADGEVEDTCITLEWEDDPVKVAEFFMIEWERITEAWEKGVYANG
jgi:hypothetical protein